MANGKNPEIFKKTATIVESICKLKGEKFSEALTVYMMKLLSIHPKYESIAAENDAEALSKFLAEDCITLYLMKTNPAVLVLKMQVYFDLNYRSSEQFGKEYQENCKRRCSLFLRKILAVTTASLRHDIVLGDIVMFVLIQQEGCDRFDANKLNEMKNIVLSMLPLSEISRFLEFNQKERNEYVTELAPVASGIRLYTIWNSEHGQAAVDKIASKLVEEVPKLLLALRREFSQTQELIQRLQDVLQYYLLMTDLEEEELSYADLSYYKTLLTFLNQYSFFYCSMMEECDALALRSFRFQQSFRQAINNLRLVVSNEVTIPSTAFSYYKEVGMLWKFIKNELLFFKSLIAIFKQLKEFRKNAQMDFYEKKMLQLWNRAVEKMNQKASEETEVESKKIEVKSQGTEVESQGTQVESQGIDVESQKTRVKFQETDVKYEKATDSPDENDDENNSTENKDSIRILLPESLKNTDEVSLEFEGFCLWALIYGEGLLLPVNRKLGLVMYQARCYGFSCAEGRNAFLENPDVFLNSVWDFIRTQEHLVVVLKLHQKFGIDMHTDDTLDNYFVPPIFISSMACQTDVHPIEERNEEGYTWNQWLWRERALKYVDIKTKRTHSTQTDLSHFRRENFSQVYLPKENWCQTKRDGSTTMPKKGIPELIVKVRTSIL